MLNDYRCNNHRKPANGNICTLSTVFGQHASLLRVCCKKKEKKKKKGMLSEDLDIPCVLATRCIFAGNVLFLLF